VKNLAIILEEMGIDKEGFEQTKPTLNNSAICAT
jgi:hypothetical protein